MNARPGVCGVCGCAVVRMNPDEHGKNSDVDGHVYKSGKLVRVRCHRHKEYATDNSPEADACGGQKPRFEY